MRGRAGWARRAVVVSDAVTAWKRVPNAVVTKGKDVTPEVGAPKWKIVGG